MLDECQEIKAATTAIAKTCRDLSSEHRWMVRTMLLLLLLLLLMLLLLSQLLLLPLLFVLTSVLQVSGTPLTTSVDDLNGELQFLQVCLHGYTCVPPTSTAMSSPAMVRSSNTAVAPAGLALLPAEQA